ncbi:hypothetical protein OG394_34070 [Kribbella sp. NBC_01245]|uniref:hypothetical protein n=1 Tax=Kribbella sp. NBC_01245 TaxID=2903578 RepID=UPI002E285CA9|nr:hypothetical protein [Kribbella sp. NBC_01245]
MYLFRSIVLCACGVVIAGCASTPDRVNSADERPTITSSTPATGAVGTRIDELRVGSVTVRVQPNETRTSVSVLGGASRQVEVDGRWVLPRVVANGPSEGATPDGALAVLAEAEAEAGSPRGRVSRFMVVDLKAATSELVELDGDFTYDAWSPDGSLIYFIEHRKPAGSGKYVVRAYDRVAAALRPDAVADKRTLGEEMAGLPIARAAGRGGRSVATLYVPHPSGAHGAGHEGLGRPHGPFVHLLFADTASALCVDLPAEVGRGWTFAVDGKVLRISRAGVPRAYAIDLESGALTSRAN